MWVCLNNAFLSIVEHRDNSSLLMVRARRWEDLLNTFPSEEHDIIVTPDADYPYRLILPRGEVRYWLYEAVDRISYPNFKASVPASDPDRKKFYGQVWQAGHDFGRKVPIRSRVPKPDDSDTPVMFPPWVIEPREARGLATRESWKNEDMRAPQELDFEDEFTALEWRVIQRGFVPSVMEEKWFVHVDGDHIRFHRSWTGFEQYRARFVSSGKGVRITGAQYETDTESYISGGPDYERGMLRWLFRGFLLQHYDVPFPIYPGTPPGAELGILQHHVGGSIASAPYIEIMTAAADLAGQPASNESSQQGGEMRGKVHQPGRVIWKVQFDERNQMRKEMPRGWEPLDLQLQNEIATLWFTCERDAPLEMNYFWLCASGYPTAPVEARFLGTVQFKGGRDVWHLFHGEREEG